MRYPLFLLFFVMFSSIDSIAQVKADCYAVIESETGRVLLEKSSGESRPVASLTKVATALAVRLRLANTFLPTVTRD